MNSVILIGRLTREPELRSTSEGKLVCRFSLAVDGYNDKTDFINIVVWEKQAENLCKYCSKGRQIAVAGRISTRNYDDENGNKVYVTEVVANQIKFLDKKENKEDMEYDSDVDFDSDVELTDDDLPF